MPGRNTWATKLDTAITRPAGVAVRKGIDARARRKKAPRIASIDVRHRRVGQRGNSCAIGEPGVADQYIKPSEPCDHVGNQRSGGRRYDQIAQHCFGLRAGAPNGGGNRLGARPVAPCVHDDTTPGAASARQTAAPIPLAAPVTRIARCGCGSAIVQSVWLASVSGISLCRVDQADRHQAAVPLRGLAISGYVTQEILQSGECRGFLVLDLAHRRSGNGNGNRKRRQAMTVALYDDPEVKAVERYAQHAAGIVRVDLWERTP